MKLLCFHSHDETLDTLKIGFCVNCEATRKLTSLGTCETCGSDSIWIPNAVKEMERIKDGL